MCVLHFRMIREENSSLRKSLENREKQLTEFQSLKKMAKQQKKELQETQVTQS